MIVSSVSKGSSKNTDIEEDLGRIFDPISAADFLQLCIGCLFLAEREIGSPTKPYGAVKQGLSDYVRLVFAEVFESTNEEKLVRAAREFPDVPVNLLVTVVQAEGLISRDVSGKSDPYCVLQVGSSEKHLTSVVRKTINPSWNEAFRIHIEDPSSDAFHLQVWDKDPRTLCGAFQEIRDVRSCASCCHFLRELFETLCFRDKVDDFMGSVFKFINEVPCTGGEQWFQLKDARGQGAYGRVYLKLGFECTPSGHSDTWSILKQHYYLCLVFFLHHATSVHPDIVIGWSCWEQCLSEEGLTLLHRHALHKNLADVEQCFCKITTFANVAKANQVRINFSVLYRLLSHIRSLLKICSHQLVANAMENVIRVIATSCLLQFRNLHEQFRFTKKQERIDLLGLLFCCVSVEALIAVEVTDPACTDIRKEASTWYKSLLDTEECKGRDPALLYQQLQKVLATIQTYHNEADQIFKAAWNETYTQIVSRELDAFVVTSFEPGVRRTCSDVLSGRKPVSISDQETNELSLKMFYVIRAFLTFVSNALSVEREELQLDRFQEWFGTDLVVIWFDLAKAPVCGWISDLVSKDDMSPLARDIKHGTSFRDTQDIFHARYVQLWEKLELRDFSCGLAFSRAMSEGGLHFAKALADRIACAGFFDTVDEFEISKELCVAISSLTSMSTLLQNTITQIERTFEPGSGLETRTSQMVFPLEKALDEVLVIVTKVCTQAVEKLMPHVRSKLAAVSDAESGPLQERRLYELVEYADACIATLYDNLEALAFRKILRQLWRCTVNATKTEANLVQEQYMFRFNTAPLSYVGLHKALLRMKDVFHASGEGLPESDINIKPYVDFEQELRKVAYLLDSVPHETEAGLAVAV